MTKISHSGGKDSKVILANTKYEAVGFYLWEEVTDIAAESLDKVEIMPNDHVVVILDDVMPYIRTLEQIWQENDDWISPKTIVNLPKRGKN